MTYYKLTYKKEWDETTIILFISSLSNVLDFPIVDSSGKKGATFGLEALKKKKHNGLYQQYENGPYIEYNDKEVRIRKLTKLTDIQKKEIKDKADKTYNEICAGCDICDRKKECKSEVQLASYKFRNLQKLLTNNYNFPSINRRIEFNSIIELSIDNDLLCIQVDNDVINFLLEDEKGVKTDISKLDLKSTALLAELFRLEETYSKREKDNGIHNHKYKEIYIQLLKRGEYFKNLSEEEQSSKNGIGMNQATEGECEDFITFSQLFDMFKKNKDQNKVEIYDGRFVFIKHIDYSLERVRIFNITEQQKKFFLLGKPDHNMEIKLPYNHMFLDCKFTKEELLQYGIKIDASELNGVIISRGYLYKKDKIDASLNDSDFSEFLTREEEKDNFNDLRSGECLRFAISLILDKGKETEIVFDVFDKNIKLYDGYEKYPLERNMYHSVANLKERELWHNFFLNFLRFVNFPKIELKEHIRSEKSIARRIARKLPPIPATVKISVLDGSLTKYVDDFNDNVKRGWHYAYQFDVKGHYKHLRSPRYKTQRDIWVEPYKKGLGKFVPTIYEVKQKSNGNNVENNGNNVENNGDSK